jgi:hypothetical protein
MKRGGQGVLHGMDPKSQAEILQYYATKGEIIDPNSPFVGGVTPGKVRKSGAHHSKQPSGNKLNASGMTH